MFKIANMRTLKERPTELYTVGSAAITLGQALVAHTDGTLIKCPNNAATNPEYIAYSAGATGDIIPVYRVIESDVFETTFSADGTDRVIGEKVELSADAATVTATTTNGVFYITKKLGSGASGTKVQGMFRR